MEKNEEYRIEKDFIGEKMVPKNAYYGIQTLRAVENFPISGYSLDSELIRALGMVKKAAALANQSTGQLSPRLANVIINASEEIIDRKLHDQFIVDPIQGGAGTSINMNANEVITNRALEMLGEEKGNFLVLSANSHVNMSQSTNDAFPTAFRISLLNRIQGLLAVMEELHAEFENKAAEFDSILKMGRTHLQDAVPIRLGQEFSAYADVLLRDIGRLRQTRTYLYDINMGATAVGTGLNADPEYIKQVAIELSEISGYPLITAKNLIDATQNTDAYTGVSSALKICMINMSKIANDLRLMASGPRTGLNEIRLPTRQPGSSIMPGKVNPVMAEVVNQVAFEVIGNDHTITMASEAGQFELNVMEPVLVFKLLESLKMMTNVLTVFRKHCVAGIEANQEQMQDYVDRSIGIITAINPHVGYEAAASIAKEALATGEPVRKLCEQRGILTAAELDEILDPNEMTEPGISGKSLLAARI
ncbi:aspartate ammonia-lyase [Bacillaceae bacterium IKA-2]|nr:aspartate ammonia-lyase [Bacillaceae bacterium IKA-2]